MPSPDILADSISLMREIESLRRKLDQSGATRGLSNGLLAVAKLLPNISIETWENAARELGCREWIALPLEEEVYPCLVRLQRLVEELAHEAQHDLLTGLANRKAFETHLGIELARVQRENTQLSLAILDLDDFKSINDTYGHSCGDHVLAAFGHTLLREKRMYDVAARIGGEEFALLLPGAGLIKAQVMLERLLDIFSSTNLSCADGARLNVSFSAGVTTVRGQFVVTPTALVDAADKALYRAKHLGKQRVVAARLPGECSLHRTTMVHGDEKKVLFSGSGGHEDES